MTEDYAIALGKRLAATHIAKLDTRLAAIRKSVSITAPSEGLYRREEIRKAASAAYEGAGLPADMHREDFEDEVRKLAEERRHSTGYGMTLSQAEAVVLSERPELYHAAVLAKSAPREVVVEEYEPSAAEVLLAKRVTTMRHTNPTMTEEQCVAELLKADPTLYDDLEPR